MAVGEVYNLQLQYLVDARKCTFDLYYKQINSGAEAQITADLNLAFFTDVFPTIPLALSSQVEFQCLYSRHVTAGELPRPAFRGEYFPAWSPSIPDEFQFDPLTGGSLGIDALPANSCAVAKLIQNSVTSKHNGRVYIAGIPEEEVQNGQLNTSYFNGAWKAMIDKFALQILTPPLGTVFDPVVLQASERILNPSPPPEFISLVVNPPNVHEVTEIRSNRRILTQRRRTTRKTGVAAPGP